jgi:hypothetical protein
VPTGRRAPRPTPGPTPLDRLLRALARQATDPGVRRWAQALARGEPATATAEARGQAARAAQANQE